MKKSTLSQQKLRGSALSITIIFTSVMGVLGASYLKLALSEYKSSDRSARYNLAINIAELAAEEAAWALNHNDWEYWHAVTNGYWLAEAGIELGGEKTGNFIVYVDRTDVDYPVLYIEGEILDSLGTSIKKQVIINLKNRSVFASGLIAKESIVFSGGNASVDSFNSNDGNYDLFFNRNDKGFVGSLSVELDALNVSNSFIWGYVATGGEMPDFGPNGTLQGEDTPGGVDVDPNRIALDFTAVLEDVSAPDLSSPQSIPSGNTVHIGDPSNPVPQEYYVSDLDIGNNKKLVIDGPVIIVVEDDVDIKGTLEVSSTGSIEMYADGDITVGGNGIANLTNVASALRIYGTRQSDEDEDQEFKLHGNAILVGSVYAPNADISLKGGGNSGEMYGAAVGKTVHITGNYAFHYDEALDDMGVGDPSYKMELWREMVNRHDKLLFELTINDVLSQESQPSS